MLFHKQMGDSIKKVFEGNFGGFALHKKSAFLMRSILRSSDILFKSQWNTRFRYLERMMLFTIEMETNG